MNIHVLSIPCRNRAVQAFTARITERVEAFFCSVMSNGVYPYLPSLVSSLGASLMFSYEARSLIDIADWESDAKAF